MSKHMSFKSPDKEDRPELYKRVDKLLDMYGNDVVLIMWAGTEDEYYKEERWN